MRRYCLKNLVAVPLACFVFSLGVAQGQTTLAGYANSASLPNYNATTIYPLFEEWMGLIDPNLDVLPTARETDIYQEIIRAERGNDRLTSYDPDLNTVELGLWGVASQILAGTTRMKEAKDLAWLEATLDRADELLALREPAGTYCSSSGTNLQESTWMAPQNDPPSVISPLVLGRNATYLSRFSNWILEHPELYSQTAPTNSLIPLAIPGTTYYERAKFYLEEVKKTYDVFELANAWWEFDTTAQAGWIITTGDTEFGGFEAAHPGGVSMATVRDVALAEGYSLHPYNRTLFWLSGYLETARGLQMIDAYESTSLYTAFYNRAVEVATKSLNYWRDHRQTYNESDPRGINFSWPYAGDQDALVKYEDSVHFEMDLDPMTSLKDFGLLTNTDLEGVTGAIYSRWFDHESHVYFNNMARIVGTHEATGLPENPYWWWGPMRSDWIGESATHGQMQGRAMKSLEVFRERMRLASIDSALKEMYLSRDSTRRTRNMMGPFEIHNLKLTRNQRGLTPTPEGNNPPTINSASPSFAFGVPENTPLGTIVGSVSASDPDAGQTLHYWISGGNIENRFKIDPNTGTIRVNNYYALDRGQGAETPLEITVMDDGIPMELATATMNISLQSVITYTGLLTGEGFEGGESDLTRTGDTYITPTAITTAAEDTWNVRHTGSVSPYTQDTGWIAQTGNSAISFPHTTMIGAFQIIDVSSFSNLTGKTLSFSADFGRSNDDPISGLNVARYHVIGFNDKSAVLADYAAAANFTGTFDEFALVSLTGSDLGTLGTGDFKTFSTGNIAFGSDYDYIGVFIGGNTKVADAANFVVVDNVQLTISGVDQPVDTDGDGLTDAQEIALGTDPEDAGSVSNMARGTVLPSLGKMRLEWVSNTGVQYRILESSDLIDWTVARDWAAAQTPPVDVLEFDITPPSGFFKIEADIQ